MNASSMRRLAKDQATLHTSPPPNYLFPTSDDSSLPDDLSQLIILITGAHGTPYSQGVWKLHLKMPEDYPINPPKATFRTRIFHPNVDESTGAVCLETLKRDWDKKLTLKDILVTISCLLINPNPDSALNAEAGALLQEDYEAFARKAKLMTSIHAPIPKALKDAVVEAKRRGEDDGTDLQVEKEARSATSRAASSTTSVIMKSRPAEDMVRSATTQAHPISEQEEHEDDTKENDPLHSPLFPSRPPSSPLKVLGKRALSDISIPIASEQTLSNIDRPVGSETNCGVITSEHPKKSPRLARAAEEDHATPYLPTEEASNDESCRASKATSTADDKENLVATPGADLLAFTKKTTSESTQSDSPARPTLRKVSNVGFSRGKAVPRRSEVPRTFDDLAPNTTDVSLLLLRPVPFLRICLLSMFFSLERAHAGAQANCKAASAFSKAVGGGRKSLDVDMQETGPTAATPRNVRQGPTTIATLIDYYFVRGNALTATEKLGNLLDVRIGFYCAMPHVSRFINHLLAESPDSHLARSRISTRTQPPPRPLEAPSPLVQAQHEGMNATAKGTCHYFETFPA